MIKTISSIALSTLLTFTFVGCSDDPKPNEPNFACKQDGQIAPKWTCVPMAEGSYAGVGVANKSSAGIGHMRKVALANGRSELAQQIESQVKDKVETFTRTTGNGDSETVDQVSTAVSKQVAKVSLNGSKAVDAWTSNAGNLYLLVTVPKSTVNAEAKNAVKTSFKNDNALWQQFQSKNALEELEKEFPEN